MRQKSTWRNIIAAFSNPNYWCLIGSYCLGLYFQSIWWVAVPIAVILLVSFFPEYARARSLPVTDRLISKIGFWPAYVSAAFGYPISCYSIGWYVTFLGYLVNY